MMLNVLVDHLPRQPVQSAPAGGYGLQDFNAVGIFEQHTLDRFDLAFEPADALE